MVAIRVCECVSLASHMSFPLNIKMSLARFLDPKPYTFKMLVNPGYNFGAGIYGWSSKRVQTLWCSQLTVLSG